MAAKSVILGGRPTTPTPQPPKPPTRNADVPRHGGDRRPTAAEAARNAIPAKPTPRPSALKVRATRMVHYGLKRRRVGDVFVLRDPAHFSAKSMERVDAATPERITTGQQEIRRQHDEILGGRVEGRTPATMSQEVLDDDDASPLD